MFALEVKLRNLRESVMGDSPKSRAAILVQFREVLNLAYTDNHSILEELEDIRADVKAMRTQRQRIEADNRLSALINKHYSKHARDHKLGNSPKDIT